ncbi:MAG: hypothetical protein LBN37_05545 [Bacteroidales bacterium]|jgi:hypothetical protein|nr:hypothetical protein [Bacteroidales bacterium]
MKVLMMSTAVVIVAAVLYLRYIYRRYKKAPFRIRTKCRYHGGLQMSVSIYNKSKEMMEINPPIVEFRQPRMKKRRFKIIPPGDKDIFPLGLSPHTNYDFVVHFIRLYDLEERLRKYQKVAIRIEDKKGKLLMQKTVKLKQP